MNTSKSNFTLFCKGNTDKICNPKLFSQPLPHNPKPKFLGIVFDERLCFGDQIKYIQDKCLSRLNLIKILSHRTWKLGKNTLINIYRSLVGSVIDYNFFIFPLVKTSTDCSPFKTKLFAAYLNYLSTRKLADTIALNHLIT